MGVAPVKMPQLGESVTEGTVDRWLKKEGEFVKRDEPLVEVVTDKVNAEIPSPFEGTLLKISVPEGETVSVGVEIAQIETDGGPQRAPSGAAAESAAAPDSSTTSQPASAPAPEDGHAPPTGTPPARFSPAVRRLAQEHGIDPAKVPGTGGAGRVTRDDVLAFVEGTARPRRVEAPRGEAPAVPAPTPAPPRLEPVRADAPAAAEEDELVHLSAMRRSIAEHMTRSLAVSPHAWTLQEVDVSQLVAYREAQKEGFRQRNAVRLTYMPFVIQALCEALREFPWLNSTWAEDGVLLKSHLNVGLAVSVPDGLIVPVVKDADRLGFVDLARAVHDLVERARARQLRPEDVQEGTFTLNNTGPTGSVASQPIINQPQAAILTMESIVPRPVVIGEGVAIRHMMNMCLAFDHRIVDGMMAGRFLTACRTRLEAWTPASIRV
ncbi:MAG: dihydrolipoamide acetyltransferase family protein [Candidatus Dormibacterales bacterium]